MIEPAHDLFDTHEYVKSLKKRKDEAFSENYDKLKARFSVQPQQGRTVLRRGNAVKAWLCAGRKDGQQLQQ